MKREAAKVHGRVERFLTALHGREDFGEVLQRGVLLKGVMERRIGWGEREARKIEEDAVVERGTEGRLVGKVTNLRKEVGKN